MAKRFSPSVSDGVGGHQFGFESRGLADSEDAIATRRNVNRAG